MLRYKVFEPVLLLGRQRFANVDMKIRVQGGGHVSQVYGECPGTPRACPWCVRHVTGRARCLSQVCQARDRVHLVPAPGMPGMWQGAPGACSSYARHVPRYTRCIPLVNMAQVNGSCPRYAGDGIWSCPVRGCF